MKISQTKDIRTANSLTIIRHILDKKEISRARISEDTGLNKATVSTIVKDWMNLKLVEETTTGDSNGGRRPIILTLSEHAGYCIAVDMGVSHVNLILANIKNEIVARNSFSIHDTAFSNVYASLCSAIDQLTSQMPPSTYGLLGISLAVRGIIDLDGVIRFIPKLAWHNVDICSLLSDRYQVPVHIDNDGNLGASMESRLHPQYEELTVLSISDTISCGLITEGDRWMTMLDIQGVEDFHGDMDFKVGGTRKGITAIQMDIKIDGLTYDIIAEAFEKCRRGRLYILDEIIKPVIAEPRRELSRWAPKMFSMMIPTDKIKDVIGKGGKVIQDICATCNCKIDVQEDGHVFVSAVDQEDAKRAIFTIRTIVEDPEIGAIYKGKVTRLMNFGAFVEIAPGKEGLVHISKLDTKRVERVEDVVAVGDAIVVKVTDIDQQGRINLSRRDAILALEAKKAQQEQG